MTKTRDLADLGGGFIQAGTGAQQRTVESKLQDVISAKDFGAVGDGVTDDTAAIQAAIDEAESRADLLAATDIGDANIAVDLNGGCYGISDTLTINRTIIFQNGALVALSAPTSSTFMLRIFSNAKRAVIQNIDFDGGLSGTTRYANLIEVNAERVILTNILGIHFPTYGIRYLEGQEAKSTNIVLREWQFIEAGTADDTLRTAKGFSVEDADMQFTNCVAAQCLYPLYVSSTGVLNQYVGCHFYNGGAVGPTVEASTVYLDNAVNNVFTGCYFDNGNIYIKDRFNHIITGCHFQRTGAASNFSAIRLDTSATDEDISGLNVTGCNFNGNYLNGYLEFTGTGTYVSDLFLRNMWVGNVRTDGQVAWKWYKDLWKYEDDASTSYQSGGAPSNSYELRASKNLRLVADYDTNSGAVESKIILATDNVDQFELTAVGEFNKSGTRTGLSVGSGIPTEASSNGAIYLRTDGAGTNDNLYIRRGGAWVGIA